jgi:CheY-like chemotaxis protein
MLYATYCVLFACCVVRLPVVDPNPHPCYILHPHHSPSQFTPALGSVSIHGKTIAALVSATPSLKRILISPLPPNNPHTFPHFSFSSAEWLPEALADAEIDMSPEESEQWFSHPRAGAIRVSVTDTGAGLSSKQLSEIGAEGVQFNANELQAGQGSGLGLFISKGIAHQHGGTFQVTSGGLGQGATFSIELPLFRISDNFADEVQDFDASSEVGSGFGEAGPGPPGSPRPPRRPQRVLVVDDAMSNRKLLLRIMRTKGYVCEEAEHGREAVEKYASAVERGEPFDAILSDFEMPVMNGPDSVWEMRCMGCKCFIAGITGNVMQDDIDHFKDKGADCVLTKPLNTDVFESLFRSFKPRETAYAYGRSTHISSPRDGWVHARNARDAKVHTGLGNPYEAV